MLWVKHLDCYNSVVHRPRRNPQRPDGALAAFCSSPRPCSGADVSWSYRVSAAGYRFQGSTLYYRQIWIGTIHGIIFIGTSLNH